MAANGWAKLCSRAQDALGQALIISVADWASLAS